MTFNQFANTQTPGSRYRKTRLARCQHPKQKSGLPREYTGLHLVKWLLDQGRDAEAVQIYRNIKAVT